MLDTSLHQAVADLRRAAIDVYGHDAVEQPAMAAALENVARALWRVEQAPLDPSEASLAPAD